MVYSREIVGWTLYKRLTKELVAHALLKALEKREPEPGGLYSIQIRSLEPVCQPQSVQDIKWMANTSDHEQ